MAGDLLRETSAAHFEALGRDDELARLRALGDRDAVARALPDDLLDDLAASGDAEAVTRSLTAIAAAGADSIVLIPHGADADDQMRRLAREVLPALRADRA